jgi:hypothetical protein
MRAAFDIRLVAESVRAGTIDGLDDDVVVGHERLQTVLGDFCARWNEGVRSLIHGNERVAKDVEAVVRTYVAADDQTAATFERLMTGGLR